MPVTSATAWINWSGSNRPHLTSTESANGIVDVTTIRDVIVHVDYVLIKGQPLFTSFVPPSGGGGGGPVTYSTPLTG